MSDTRDLATEYFLKNPVNKKENAAFFKKLKQRKPKNLDALLHELHNKAFQKIDCLTCANCCKTTGPLFTDKDIQRIAKYLRLSEREFIAQYLRIDEDQDYVLQQVPCPFLESDNKCGIYDFRPKACATYPHTDRVKQHQILPLTQKNCGICPAVHTIVEELKTRI
ncbi:MAG: YkgJ family cysteine cluster protein [Schleiferiaceae bacterium]|nr:YkgJ family cysteine cluster protein [Schleiferiaceae bacterium]